MPSFLQESFVVSPRLVRPGDTVTVSLATRMEYTPLTVEITERYLEQEFTVGEGIRILWDTSGDVKRGTATFTPETPGNYLIRFGELRRPFAVIDETYAAGLIIVPFATSRYPRGNRLDHYHPDIHARPVPANYVTTITDERSLDPAWDVHRTLLGFHLVYGDTVVPYLDPAGVQMLGDGNAVNTATELCQRWQTLGYPVPTVVGVDTPDAEFVQTARLCGIRGLTGLGVLSSLSELPSESVSGAIDSWKDFTPIPWRTRETLLLCPRLYRTPGRAVADDMSEFYTDIERTIRTHNIFSVVLDGDDFETVEMNRAAIAHLIGLPRTYPVIFCRFDDLLGYPLS
ncbi:MAG: hypothetical protein FJY97_08290 [candidate division Zixibacteria bacterium]|nr:hypothetical protein [candidate division Zixibacteria bacterium]